MLLLICLGLLFLAGFITVATEAFTHFLVRPSLWESLRDFVFGSWLFLLTASAWAASVWVGLCWLGQPVRFLWVLEVLSLAHFPLLAYPLTITPTIGYRLEQLLRMAVFLVLAVALSWRCDLSLQTAALLALPGWLLHFLVVERSLFRLGKSA